MKLIISISLILFSVFVSAQSQVKLIVIDGYTNEPMSNCEVQLTKKNNKLLTEFTSSEGIIEIELSELKNSKLEIIDGQNHFLRYYFEKYKTNPDTILVHMIPTVAWTLLMLMPFLAAVLQNCENTFLSMSITH